MFWVGPGDEATDRQLSDAGMASTRSVHTVAKVTVVIKNVVYFEPNIPHNNWQTYVPACLIHLWKLMTVYSFINELKSYYTAKLKTIVVVLKSMLYLSNTAGATIPLVGVSMILHTST